jgi:hypothetical protein
VEGEEQIFHTRDDLNKQMTAMRARFKDYTTYAETPFRKSFLDEELKDAIKLKAERFETSYLENLGNGKFQFHNLPSEIQLSPVFGMLVEDFDRDGNLDVMTVGNSFSTEVNIGRYDAQGSLFLKGNGKGDFTAKHSFFSINGDNKSITKIHSKDNESVLLIGANSEKLKVYKQIQTENKVVKLLPSDIYGIISLANGKKYKQEFYWGQGYLSQQGRTIDLPNQAKQIVIFDGKLRRTLKLN